MHCNAPENWEKKVSEMSAGDDDSSKEENCEKKPFCKSVSVCFDKIAMYESKTLFTHFFLSL